MKKDMHLIQVLPTNGIYTLIIFLSMETRLNVGKLGQQKFPKGYYAYTGSALGKGASSLKRRVSRHLQKEKQNFWHIDFLLANENATITAVVAAQTNRKLECNLNRYIKREGGAKIPVKGFGASDCRENCKSHLLFFPDTTKDHILAQKIVEYYKRHFKKHVLRLLRSTYVRARKNEVQFKIYELKELISCPVLIFFSTLPLNLASSSVSFLLFNINSK